MIGRRAARARGRAFLLATSGCLFLASPVQGATTDPSPARIYATVDPMNRTISTRLIPQVEALLERLLREKRAMQLDGVAVFESGDKFLPGKIAVGLVYPLLAMDRNDPRFPRLLAGYREIADLTVADANETWGIYYYLSALYQLQRAGLLERAISPATLARLRRQLDWRNFVDAGSWRLIDLPNNYYGVAFSAARLRMLLGWEDASASEQLLARMLDHYRTYSGPYGFADETDGNGRFDRYSVLLIAEIAHRFTETGMTPTLEVRDWLRRSARLMLLRANMAGTGWEYGRSIGAYGESAALEIFAAAADLGLLTRQERDMAYAFSSRVAARYADFWLDPDTGSVNMWSRGRRTDAYRDRHRILGENLSLARQYIYTNAIWNRLGYRDRAPRTDYERWLGTLPRSSFLYFARGAHDRALLTIRDRGHVIGLPLINGAAGQHMHNPYFPIPFAAGLLQGSADATFPQLVPRITLADGSVLMPLAWFRDVRMERDGNRTVVSYRMDAMDRMGGNDAAQDRRVAVETRYVFSPGRIERADRFTASPGIGIASVELEFATFSSAPVPQAGAIRFRAGDVTRFAWRGPGSCAPRTMNGAPYQAPDRPFATVVACRAGGVRFDRPVEMGWTIDYR
jgi:hypothetical protein